MKKAVAFTGPSNSGKTTLIVKVANILKQEYKVAIVKNDPKDKARFDVEGKDSYKFFETGADVVVTSPTRTTMFKNSYCELDEITAMLGEFEILLVEGLKTLPLPRIGVFRERLDEGYFEHIKALAVDDSIDLNQYNLPSDIKILELNTPENVVKWIIDNAKEIG